MFEYIVMAVSTIVGWEMGKKIIMSYRYQYSWSCPDCSFKYRTNVSNSMPRVKASHNLSHVGDDNGNS